MPLSIDQFWELADQSGLFDRREVESLRKEYLLRHPDPMHDTAEAAARWLLEKKRRISGYQARQLLTGSTGPFVFGEYLLLQRQAANCPSIDRFGALHRSTGHRVLLTFLRARKDGDWQQARDYWQQGKRDRHVNLDRWFELCESDQPPFAVTQWPPGKDLRKTLKARGRLPQSQACQIAYQAALATAYLHSRNRTHAAICPEQLVLQDGGHVQLLRLAFPPIHDLSVLVTHPSPWVAYAAPEFLQEDAAADSLTDVYALGCTLYEMLTGRRPFGGDQPLDVLKAHATQRIGWFENEESIPAGLREIVAYMMAKKRELRYQHMDDVIDKLEPFLPNGVKVTKPTMRPTATYYLAHLKTATVEPSSAAHAALPTHLARESEQSGSAGDYVEESLRPQVVVEPSRSASITSRKPTKKNATGLSMSHRRNALFIAISIVATCFLFMRLAEVGILPTPNSISRSESDPTQSVNRVSPASDQADAVRDVQGMDAPVQLQTGGPNWEIATTDDGRMLWMEASAGPPIDLSLTPPGAQCYLFVRPKQWTGHPQGAAALEAAGASVAAARTWLRTTLGVELRDLSELLVSLTSNDSSEPEITIELLFDGDDVEHNPLWGELRMAAGLEGQPTAGGEQGRIGAFRVYFPAGQPNRAVIGSDENIGRIVEQRVAILPTYLAQLNAATSRARPLTLLIRPSFLRSDAGSLLRGKLRPIRLPLLRFLGDRTRAFSLSVGLESDLYVEAHWISQAEENPFIVAQDRRRQVVKLPSEVNDYLGRASIDHYWQPLAFRFPAMLRFLADQVRIGVVGQTAIMNVVLPPVAAPNLVLATELALSGEHGLRPRTPTAVTPHDSPADLLEKHIDFAIDQQSMEVAFAELAATMQQISGRAVSIKVIGTDLQLDGITRNQQIRSLRMDDKPLRDVLTALVVRANPTPTPDPSSPQQKLIWATVPSAAPLAGGASQLNILVTTRTSAAQKGYEVPSEFLAK